MFYQFWYRPIGWLFLLLFFFSTSSSSKAQDAVPRWDEVFVGYGVNGEVNATVVDDNGDIYIAGDFTRVGGLVVNGIAKWDGIRWMALGQGIGLGSGSSIQAMTFDGNGDLMVGGTFSRAFQTNGNEVDVFNLAIWDGTKWEAVASGVDDVVYDLLYDEGNGVYIAGAFARDGRDEFELNKIALWNGNNLSPVGDGLGTFSAVVAHTLAMDSQGTLHAAGTELAGGIFRWDGQDWTSFGARHDDTIYDMAIDDRGWIYVGGDFRSLIQPDDSSIGATRVGVWNGTQWEVLGSGFNSTVRTVALGANGDLFAGGSFTASGDDATAYQYVAQWNGDWQALGQAGESGPLERVNALTFDENDALIAGGKMELIGGSLLNGIGFWANQQWSGIGGYGADGEIKAFYMDPNGVLYAGGDFTYLGSQLSNRIARWETDQWVAIGQGTDGAVNAIQMDSQGMIYVGGEFTSVFQTDGTELEANNIAVWNGTLWSTLGSGVDGAVTSLAIDASDNLYVGGLFTQDALQQTTLNYIAHWDGALWTSLGGGMDGGVYAMHINDTGEITAGGAFTSAGSVSNTNFLAVWNGTTWSPVSAETTLDAQVLSITEDSSGILTIGGSFTQVTAELPAFYVAQWDGAAWGILGTALGNGVSNCCVRSLTHMADGALIVGGDFGGVRLPSGLEMEANSIVSWTTEGGWLNLDGGVDASVLALVSSEEDLFAGGKFQVAGVLPSSYVARWSPGVTYVSTEDESDIGPTSSVHTNLYPNPVNQRATIQLTLSNTQELQVEVIDILGRRVQRLYQGVANSSSPLRFDVDTSNWPAGLYMVRISGETVNEYRPFVRIK